MRFRPGRLGLSAIDKREIWSRWKAGETLHEIGRAYGKCHNAIRAVLPGSEPDGFHFVGTGFAPVRRKMKPEKRIWYR